MGRPASKRLSLRRVALMKMVVRSVASKNLTSSGLASRMLVGPRVAAAEREGATIHRIQPKSNRRFPAGPNHHEALNTELVGKWLPIKIQTAERRRH